MANQAFIAQNPMTLQSQAGQYVTDFQAFELTHHKIVT